MPIDFNVFSMFMNGGIPSNEDCHLIIAVHGYKHLKGDAQVFLQRSEPNHLTNCHSHSTVLDYFTQMRNHFLLPLVLGNRIVSNKFQVAHSGLPISYVPSIVEVNINLNKKVIMTFLFEPLAWGLFNACKTS